jgi:hypothetical protein
MVARKCWIAQTAESVAPRLSGPRSGNEPGCSGPCSERVRTLYQYGPSRRHDRFRDSVCGGYFWAHVGGRELRLRAARYGEFHSYEALMSNLLKQGLADDNRPSLDLANALTFS